jgi:hypothetical protein
MKKIWLTFVRRETWSALARVAVCAAACGGVAAAQGEERGRRVAPPPVVSRADESFVSRASDAACVERELDPRGSVPIDVMQARPSLPTRHPEALAGAQRAERLLPAAKELAAESLRALAREHGLRPATLAAALARVAEVRRVRPDVELRDNASVVYDEPRTIRFGTIFLAGLRSDEGMLSVLAHELVHVADGPRGALGPLFRRVGERAVAAGGVRRISARRAEELTCDLVGVMAVRLYVARGDTGEPLALRASRAVAHNCVEHDETDSAHLSPRATMRAIFALAPDYAAEITGDAPAHAPAGPLNHTAPPPRPVPPDAETTPSAPRTTTRPASKPRGRADPPARPRRRPSP